MRRRRRRLEEQENHERWLLTYSDLITLLLAFFIMMYTLSRQDAQKYQEVSDQLRVIFSGGAGVMAKGGGTLPVGAVAPAREASNSEIMKQLEDELKNAAVPVEMQRNLTILLDDRGIIVRALDQAFFEEGKADLQDKAKNTINRIIPILKQVNRDVRIEGHTDNVPISTPEFKSNWELSVKRATEVVRYIIEKGGFPPEMISASGYAEFRPLVPNINQENRSKNRRIEIIMEKPKSKKQQS
jgi:chemotaxis protein MotB